MPLFSFFLSRPKRSATVAKERLQLVLARERADRDGPDYLPALKRELLEVVCKYVAVDLDDVQVNLERDGNYEVLELNIVLPDSENTARAVVRKQTPYPHPSS
jgi:cell division topological specificity factor